MTYEELVQQVKDIAESADAGAVQEHVAFQFNIEGEAEGAFYLDVRDGKADVEPYEYYDRDVLITCTAQTLLDIVEGKALLLKEVVGQKKAKKKPGRKKAK